MEHYDFIIAGSGAAGMMTAYFMSQDSFFDSKSILIIDKEVKDQNDRTWCYWENGKGQWDQILPKEWKKIFFAGKNWLKHIDLNDYSYKMIRSKDFYQFVHTKISEKQNFKIITEDILTIDDQKSAVIVKTDRTCYSAGKVLSSIFNPAWLEKNVGFPYLKQHFIGWFVKTKKPIFDEKVAGFMDFDIPQNGNTRFMYVLPTAADEALIEYTLFSENLLDAEEYESEIKSYIQEKYKINDYTIIEKETGNIPMTCYPFEKHNTSNVMYIGSAGGWTKPSTGYTFARSTRIAQKLVKFLKSNTDLTKFSYKNRYWYYDLIFIKVLADHNEAGQDVFTSIFKHHRIENIFKFLDEENSFLNDLKLMWSTGPQKLFIQAAMKSTGNIIA